MNTPPSIPPVIKPTLSITYELTRWDLFANFFTVLLRNRILQVVMLGALVFNAFILYGPGVVTRPISRTVLDLVIYVIGFVAVFAFFQCVVGLAMAFILKQRGVVGQHVLEITEQGLIERTEYNETLHKWTSIGRTISLCGYLYIYVSDTNSHQIPKRQFSVQELSSFEADLRAHVQSVKS